MVLVERTGSPLPRTSNTLTRVERAHRRRSANKVGRVLGITPQVMDLGSATATDRYWSMTTAIISSHVSLPALPYVTSTEFEDEHDPYNDAVSIKGRGFKRTMKSTGMHCPPLLHVATRSTHFHPLSKFKINDIDPSAPEVDDDLLPELFTSSSTEDDDVSDPPSPTLSTVSRIAMRRRKMERLQRMLGEDVPVNMVFPQNQRDNSGLARDDMHVIVQTRSRTRPQSAPVGSAHIFLSGALEEALSRNSTTRLDALAMRADQRSELGKSVTSLAHETSSSVLRRKLRKRPDTPRPPSSFRNRKSSLAQESVLVLPPTPVSSKTPVRKGPTAPRPHYRPQSYFQTNNNNNNKIQPLSAAKYSYIYYPTLSNSNISCGDGKTAQIMEFGEAKCLRTVIESPDELASVLAQDSSELCHDDEGQEVRLSSSSSSSSSSASSSGMSSYDMSLASEWDNASTAIHVPVGDPSGTAAVKADQKQDPDAESGKAEAAKHVWRHKRKPPPVYVPERCDIE